MYSSIYIHLNSLNSHVFSKKQDNTKPKRMSPCLSAECSFLRFHIRNLNWTNNRVPPNGTLQESSHIGNRELLSVALSVIWLVSVYSAFRANDTGIPRFNCECTRTNSSLQVSSSITLADKDCGSVLVSEMRCSDKERRLLGCYDM
jgi:hypothetical protein